MKIDADGNRWIRGIYSYRCFLCKQRIGDVHSRKRSIEMKNSSMASVAMLRKLLPLRSRFPSVAFSTDPVSRTYFMRRCLRPKDSSRKWDGLQSADQ